MKSMKTLAIVGCGASEETFNSLSSMGFSVLILPCCDALPSPVSSHADMLMLELDGHVFCQKEYFKKAADVFEKISDYGYTAVPCDVCLGNRYPNDIAFNIAVCNNVLYGNTRHNAKEVTEFAKARGFSVSNVKQGYAKCSTVCLANDAVITADSGIADVADKNGLKVLKINNSPDSVSLDGYNYGFIGGACGVFGNTVYFSGNIDLHPESQNIKSFCQSLGFNCVSLSKSKLTDVGGIIFLPYIR